MSSIKIVCPPTTEIGDISTATCLEDFGQIQKAAFQRQFASAGVKNSFTATGAGDIKLKASWDAYMAAADSTKIQITPDIEAPTFNPGGARTTGGGNATIGGITKNIGIEPTSADFTLNSYNQGIIEELKAYQQELALGVLLFNEHGQIGCITDNRTTPTAYYSIPIAPRTLFVGDKMFGGLEAEDNNKLLWQFLPNWSDKFVVVNPTDFNPLTDLVNP
jgi:hypothetical protein